jgi:hypothetical protein
VNSLYAEVFGKVVEMRKLLDEKQLEKVSDRDVRMSKEYVRRFVSDVRKIVEEKPLPKTEKRAPIKMGEARELIDTAKEVTGLKESTTEPLVAHERLERIEEKIEKEQKKHRVVKKGARKTQVKAGK